MIYLIEFIYYPDPKDLSNPMGTEKLIRSATSFEDACNQIKAVIPTAINFIDKTL